MGWPVTAIDTDMMDFIELQDDAFDNAVEAATEAHVAGLEPAEQLEHGIKAYLLTLETMGYRIVAAHATIMPKTIEEAAAMHLVAQSYLTQHGES